MLYTAVIIPTFKLPLLVTRRDKIHEGVSRVLNRHFLRVGRVLVKAGNINSLVMFQSVWRMILDYRACRTRNDFWSFFEHVGENVCPNYSFFHFFQIRFGKFSRVYSRCLNFFYRMHARCFLIIEGVEHSTIFEALFPRVSTRCW